MKVLITGANYNNKGAQSMLFVAADEIRKSFPDCEILFATKETIDSSNLRLQPVFYTYEIQNAILGKLSFLSKAKKNVKQIIKFVLRRSKKFTYEGYIKSIETRISDVDVILDVSGLALSDKQSYDYNEWYLNHIRIAKKFNIPIYLMPQSFGPFEYDGLEEKEVLLSEIKELLQYPRIIFPREQEGYDFLEKSFGLHNLVLSTDTVLQNSGVNLKGVFKSEVKLNVHVLDTENNVAVIPNSKCFDRIEAETLLSMYDRLIRKLLLNGKTVYVFRHAGEDLNICKQIKNRFGEEGRVILLERDFSCLEYDEFVKNFDFIICSRYHGIVHAFRNGIPAIALGWAIKYKELLHNTGQDKYEFDITSKEFDVNDVETALDRMLEEYKQESKCIKEKVSQIQQVNCYDLVVRDYKALSVN